MPLFAIIIISIRNKWTITSSIPLYRLYVRIMTSNDAVFPHELLALSIASEYASNNWSKICLHQD